MLAYLDTLIGFAVVMLVISLLITILTQMGSSLLNHRGGNLLWGLKTLFAEFDPKTYGHLAANAESLATHVLTHPLVSDSWFSGNVITDRLTRFPAVARLFARFQLASAIRVNELQNVMRHLASNALAGQPVAADINRLLGTAQAAVAVAPAGVAAGVQGAVAAVRTDADELASWFSSLMDRVAQRFATYMRIWTVGFAVIFALGTGLNAITLAGTIYQNSTLRSALLSSSPQVAAAAQATFARDTGSSTAVHDEAQDAKDLLKTAQQAGFDIFALSWPKHYSNFSERLEYLLGVLLTALLLSMGAPFWYNAIKSITNLRPIVAAKEDSESAQS